MNNDNKNFIWDLIQKRGDYLKNKLKPHPHHPQGRNPYAHICSLINQRFKCSYKEVPDKNIEQLKKFILNIKE